MRKMVVAQIGKDDPTYFLYNGQDELNLIYEKIFLARNAIGTYNEITTSDNEDDLLYRPLTWQTMLDATNPKRFKYIQMLLSARRNFEYERIYHASLYEIGDELWTKLTTL